MTNILNWTDKFEQYLLSHEFKDGSHDLAHSRRVWKTARRISPEDVDELIILASCYFHDIVNYPKNHPARSTSSRDAALKTRDILIKMNFPKEKLICVEHCIEAHSFSANISPESDEAKIVQDADKMEALGAIGLARTFYVAGQLGSKLFSDKDPFGISRDLDDRKYALDHFKNKLLKLPSRMQTKMGKNEALRRVSILERFMDDLAEEL